ncbi:hypothetical protein ABZP36_001225 [Zizania latifolia]
MTTSANLAQLLPTGTVLVYQALAPSFTNHGECTDAASDLYLTIVLVAVLTVSCVFLSFTDSIVIDEEVYYGLATPQRLNLINFPGKEEEDRIKRALEERRLQLLDFVHAFFTALVFLTIAFSDVGLQRCFFGPNPSHNTGELLKNLPLGMAVLSSVVFTIFPTNRKGIGHTDSSPTSQPPAVHHDSHDNASRAA